MDIKKWCLNKKDEMWKRIKYGKGYAFYMKCRRKVRYEYFFVRNVYILKNYRLFCEVLSKASSLSRIMFIEVKFWVKKIVFEWVPKVLSILEQIYGCILDCIIFFVRKKLYNYTCFLLKFCIIFYTWPYFLIIHFHVWLFSKIYLFLFKHKITETRFFNWFKNNNSILLKKIIAVPVMFYINHYNYRIWISNVVKIISFCYYYVDEKVIRGWLAFRHFLFRSNTPMLWLIKCRKIFYILYDYGECKRFMQRYYIIKYLLIPLFVFQVAINYYIWAPIEVVRLYLLGEWRYIKWIYKRRYGPFLDYEIKDAFLDFLLDYLPSIIRYLDKFIDFLIRLIFKCAYYYFGKDVYAIYKRIKDQYPLSDGIPYFYKDDVIQQKMLDDWYEDNLLKIKYKHQICDNDWNNFFSEDFFYENSLLLSLTNVVSLITQDIKDMFILLSYYQEYKVDFFTFKFFYIRMYYYVHDRTNPFLTLMNIISNEKEFFRYYNKLSMDFFEKKFDIAELKKTKSSFFFRRIGILFLFILKYFARYNIIDIYTAYKFKHYCNIRKVRLDSINAYYSVYLKLLLSESFFFKKLIGLFKFVKLWRKRLFNRYHRAYYFKKRYNEIRFQIFLFSEYKGLSVWSACLSYLCTSTLFYIKIIRIFFICVCYYLLISILLIVLFLVFNIFVGVSLYLPDMLVDLITILKVTFCNGFSSLHNVLLYFIQAFHVQEWRLSDYEFIPDIFIYVTYVLFDNVEFLCSVFNIYMYNIVNYININVIYSIVNMLYFIYFYVLSLYIFFLKFFYVTLGDFISNENLLLEKCFNWWVWVDFCRSITCNYWCTFVTFFENDVNFSSVFDAFHVWKDGGSGRRMSSSNKGYLLVDGNKFWQNQDLLNLFIIYIDSFIVFLGKVIIFNVNLINMIVFYVIPSCLFTLFNLDVNELVMSITTLSYLDIWLKLKLICVEFYILDNCINLNTLQLIGMLQYTVYSLVNWSFIIINDQFTRFVLMTIIVGINENGITYDILTILLALYEVLLYVVWIISYMNIETLSDIIYTLYVIIKWTFYNIYGNEINSIYIYTYIYMYACILYDFFNLYFPLKYYVHNFNLLAQYIDAIIDWVILEILVELYIWFIGVPYCITMYSYSTFMVYFYRIFMFLTEPIIRWLLHTIDDCYIYLVIAKHLLIIDILYWYRDFVYYMYLYAYNIIFILPIVIWISILVHISYYTMLFFKVLVMYNLYIIFKFCFYLVSYLVKYCLYAIGIVFFYLDITIITQYLNSFFSIKIDYPIFIDIVNNTLYMFVCMYMYIFDIFIYILFDIDQGTSLIFDYLTNIYIRLRCYNYLNRIIDAIFNISIYNSMIYYFLVLHYLWFVRVSWRRLEKMMFPERFVIHISDDELSTEALWNKYKHEIIGKNKKAFPLSFNEYCFFYPIDLVKYLSKYKDHPLSKRLKKQAFSLNEFSFSVNPYAEKERNDELNFFQIWLRRIIGKLYMYVYMRRSKFDFFKFKRNLMNEVSFLSKKWRYNCVYHYSSLKILIYSINYLKLDLIFELDKKSINAIIDKIKCLIDNFILKKNKIIDETFNFVDDSVDRFFIWYKDFYWTYVFNFDLKLNEWAFRYNRFMYKFKQDYLCVNERFRGKDFYKKEDFIGCTVELEQSILNRGILVGNVYKYKAAKKVLPRQLKFKDASGKNWIDFNEVYLNEMKLKFLSGYEEGLHWNEDLGKAVLEAYGQYKKYMLDIFQFPIAPDLTGFAVYSIENELLFSFEKYSLRRNPHFNEFFEEIDRYGTDLSIFKNTRFLFKDFSRVGSFSTVNIPHFDSSKFSKLNVNEAEVKSIETFSRKYLKLSASYENYILDLSNIVNGKPTNMFREGLFKNIAVDQMQGDLVKYFRNTAWHNLRTKHSVSFRATHFDMREADIKSLNMIKYFEITGFHVMPRIFSKGTVNNIIESVMDNLRFSFFFKQNIINNSFIIYPFASIIEYFYKSFHDKFLVGFVKFDNLFKYRYRFNRIEKHVSLMNYLNKDTYKFMNNSFLKLENKQKSSIKFNNLFECGHQNKFSKFFANRILDSNNNIHSFFNGFDSYKYNFKNCLYNKDNKIIKVYGNIDNDCYQFLGNSKSILDFFKTFDKSFVYLYEYDEEVSSEDYIVDNTDFLSENEMKLLIKQLKYFCLLDNSVNFTRIDLYLMDNVSVSLKELIDIKGDIFNIYNSLNMYELFFVESYYNKLLLMTVDQHFNWLRRFFEKLDLEVDVYDRVISNNNKEGLIFYKNNLYSEEYIYSLGLEHIKNWYVYNFSDKYIFNYMFYYSIISSFDDSYFVFYDYLYTYYIEYVYSKFVKVNNKNIHLYGYDMVPELAKLKFSDKSLISRTEWLDAVYRNKVKMWNKFWFWYHYNASDFVEGEIIPFYKPYLPLYKVQNLVRLIREEGKLHLSRIYEDMVFVLKDNGLAFYTFWKEFFEDIEGRWLDYRNSNVYMYRDKETLVFSYKNKDGTDNDELLFVNADLLFRTRGRILSHLKMRYGGYTLIPYNFPFFYKNNRILFIDSKLIIKNTKDILYNSKDCISDMMIILPDNRNYNLLDGVEFSYLNKLNTSLFKPINEFQLRNILSDNLYRPGYEFIGLENINVYLDIINKELDGKMISFFELFLKRYFFEMEVLFSYKDHFDMFSELFFFNKLYINNLLLSVIKLRYRYLISGRFIDLGYDDGKVYFKQIVGPLLKYVDRLSNYGSLLMDELPSDNNFSLQMFAFKIIRQLQYSEHNCNLLFCSDFFNGSSKTFEKALFYKSNFILPNVNYRNSVYYRAKNLFKEANRSVVNEYNLVMRIIVPKNCIYFDNYHLSTFDKVKYLKHIKYDYFYKPIYKNVFFQFFSMNFYNLDYVFFNKKLFNYQASFIFDTFFNREFIWLRRFIFEIENWNKFNKFFTFTDCYKYYSAYVKLYTCIYMTIRDNCEVSGELATDRIFLEKLSKLDKLFLLKKSNLWLVYENLIFKLDDILKKNLSEDIFRKNMWLSVFKQEKYFLNNAHFFKWFEIMRPKGDGGLGYVESFSLKSFITSNPIQVLTLKGSVNTINECSLLNLLHEQYRLNLTHFSKNMSSYLNMYCKYNNVSLKGFFMNLCVLKEYKELYALDFFGISYDKTFKKLSLYFLYEQMLCETLSCNIVYNYDVHILKGSCGVDISKIKLLVFDEDWKSVGRVVSSKYIIANLANIVPNIRDSNIFTEKFDLVKVARLYNLFNVDFFKFIDYGLVNSRLFNLLNCDSTDFLFKLFNTGYQQRKCISVLGDSYDGKELLWDWTSKISFSGNSLIRYNEYVNGLYGKLGVPSVKVNILRLNRVVGSRVDLPTIMKWHFDYRVNSNYLDSVFFFDNRLGFFDQKPEVFVGNNSILDNIYSNRLFFLVNSISRKNLVVDGKTIYLYRLISLDDFSNILNLNIHNKNVCFITPENINFYTSIVQDMCNNAEFFDMFYERVLFEYSNALLVKLYPGKYNLVKVVEMFSEICKVGIELLPTINKKFVLFDIKEKKGEVEGNYYLQNILLGKWSFSLFKIVHSNLLDLNNNLVDCIKRSSIQERVFSWTVNDEFNYRKFFPTFEYIRYSDIKGVSNAYFSKEDLFVNTVLSKVNFDIHNMEYFNKFIDEKFKLNRIIGASDYNDLFCWNIGKLKDEEKDNKFVLVEIYFNELLKLMRYFEQCSPDIVDKYWCVNTISMWFWPDLLERGLNLVDEFNVFYKDVVNEVKVEKRSLVDFEKEVSNEIMFDLFVYTKFLLRELRFLVERKNDWMSRFNLGVYADNKDSTYNLIVCYLKWYIRLNNFVASNDLYKSIDTKFFTYKFDNSLDNEFDVLESIYASCLIYPSKDIRWNLIDFKMDMMEKFLSYRYNLSLLLFSFPRFFYFFNISEKKLTSVDYLGDKLNEVGFFKSNGLEKYDYGLNFKKFLYIYEFYIGKLNYKYIKYDTVSVFNNLVGDSYGGYVFESFDWTKNKEFLFFSDTVKVGNIVNNSAGCVINTNVAFCEFYKKVLLKDSELTHLVSGYLGLNINPLIFKGIWRELEKAVGKDITTYVSGLQNSYFYSALFFSFLPLVSHDFHRIVMCKANVGYLQFFLGKNFTEILINHSKTYDATICRLPLFFNRFIQNIELFRFTLLSEPKLIAKYFKGNYKLTSSLEEKNFIESFNRNVLFIDGLKKYLESLSTVFWKKYFVSDDYSSITCKDDSLKHLIFVFEAYHSVIGSTVHKGNANEISFLNSCLAVKNLDQRFKLLKHLLLQIKVSASLYSNNESSIEKFFSEYRYNYVNKISHELNINWISSQRDDKSFAGLFVTSGIEPEFNDMIFFGGPFQSEEANLLNILRTSTRCYVDYRMLKHPIMKGQDGLFIALFDKYMKKKGKEISSFLMPVHDYFFFEFYLGKPELKHFNAYNNFYTTSMLESYEYCFVARTNISLTNSMEFLLKNPNRALGADWYVPTVKEVLFHTDKLIEIANYAIRGILLDDLSLNVKDENNLCSVNFDRSKLISLVNIYNYFHKDFYGNVSKGIREIEAFLLSDKCNSMDGRSVFTFNSYIQDMKKELSRIDNILMLLSTCIKFYCLKHEINDEQFNLHVDEADRFIKIGGTDYEKKQEVLGFRETKVISDITVKDNFEEWLEDDDILKGKGL